LLERFRKSGGSVIHVQHVANRPGSTFFLPDTEGVQIHENVRPLPEEVVVVKSSPNSFSGTALETYLKSLNVDKLVVCGMMTNMCVDATVRSARDKNFSIQLAADACATRALEFGGNKVSASDVQTAFLAGLNGFYSKVCSTEEILAELDS
jgi:nicotinamidase-related amidase